MVAALVRVDAEPGPRTATSAERVPIELRRFVERSSLATFATDEQIGEVAGGADFLEPELAPAAVFGSVDESGPVDVIHMSSWTGAHEAGGHDGQAVEAPPLVQRLAVHKTPPTLRPVVASGFLHHEPLGEPPRPDAPRRGPGLVRLRRRRVEPRRRHAGHRTELAGQPRLHDLVEASRVRPGVEPADDRRVPGKIDERARSVGGDHLALADLAVPLAAHAPSPTCRRSAHPPDGPRQPRALRFTRRPPPAARSDPAERGRPRAPRHAMTDWRGISCDVRIRNPCRASLEGVARET